MNIFTGNPNTTRIQIVDNFPTATIFMDTKLVIEWNTQDEN
jgi:hypothetical protein